MTLRLVTWNIKTGGVDRGRGDRLGAVVEVLRGARPDLLALQELRDFDRHGGRRMRAVADALGMTAHLSRSVFGQPVAVLARPPLRFTRTASVRWRLHHAAAVATVSTDAGPLTVVSTHLNPFSPYRRLREARWLAARYASGTRLVLLAGDLNSLDPDTDHTGTLARLAPLHRRRHLAADGGADTRAMAAFARAGFADLWRGDGDGRTAPTSAGGGAEFSGMRLDYVLAGPAAAGLAGGTRVVRGGAAEHASDHYPVAVDLDLTAAR
ncbi:endonuclease/exonuclease/phosphatase family protein [Jidongwangia harbinensis]|uniref:endonuclease/exonuclease/phosphatase family protein n=1 Tax=Jidongwangia harbinensis TaxID=2878561 RepID=UPI001CD99EC2|nr:endonuclease/exonuclease/phosphatase family protein [Jidongwangia harbinensis]MCA2217683.1 endonuclease/exonuclease/phosphatase family protein [Jidongwangia harbinensis]